MEENSATAGVKRIVAHAKLVNAEKPISTALNTVTKVKDITYCAEIALQKMKMICDQGGWGELPDALI